MLRGKDKARSRPKSERRVRKTVEKCSLEVTMAIIGAEKVGKTAMVSQFLWQGFVQDYMPTVEEFNWIEYGTDEGNGLMLKIIDSSGSRDFLAMRNLYIKTSDAFLIVFAVDDRNSLTEAEKIIEDIFSVRGRKKAPVVLVANKTDVLEENNNAEMATEAMNISMRLDVPLLRCSAINEVEVRACFAKLMDALRRQRNINVAEMRKRRQSMPSARPSIGVDTSDIDNLKIKQKQSCVIT